jgi:KaiC/GvpD/RAD55 family RecA-like ATPase
MTIPVEVAGLDTIIPTLDEGNLLVIESGPDPAKSFFIRRLARTALAAGIPVTYLISRDQRELRSLLKGEGGSDTESDKGLLIEELDQMTELNGAGDRGGLLAVDSFSFLTLDLPPSRLAPLLRNLRKLCRDRQTTVLLATDRGMFEPRSEAVAMHLADGVLQFHSREGTEGLARYIRIPKWTNGKFVDRNIYYDFDGQRIAIDLRRRVL